MTTAADPVFPLAASCCLPETRVRGSHFEKQTCTGAKAWLTSTSRWACGYRCDGTASVSLVQRYYASTYGRFNTADPYQASGGPGDPGSWNRYAYVGGDPVNFRDPNGTCAESTATSVTVCDTYTLLDFAPVISLGQDPQWNGNVGYFNLAALQAGALALAQQMQPGIAITNLSTTSAKAVAVQKELAWLQQAIQQSPTCSGWLQGSSSAIDYMLNVPGSTANMMAVGVGNFPAGTNAVAGITGTNLPPGMLITVSLNGAFFNSGPSSSVGFGIPKWITGGSGAAQAEILLHELAHDLGASGFLDDGPLPNGMPNISAQTTNNGLVMQNCGGVVDSAPHR